MEPGDIREARTAFSSIMCSFREIICPVHATLVFTIKIQSNLIMHPCKLSFALPEICRNKAVQKAHSPTVSCLQNQQLLENSDR
jgi:hypothetical protein